MSRATKVGPPHLAGGLARRVAFLIALLGIHCAARAHHEPLSTLSLTVERDRVVLVLVVPADELTLWQPPAGGQASDAHASAAAERVKREAASLLELRVNYNPLEPSSARAAAEGGNVRAEVEYPLGSDPVQSLQVFSYLVPKLSPDHKQVLAVEDRRRGGGVGRIVGWQTLTPGRYSAFVDLPPETGGPPTAPATAPADGRGESSSPAAAAPVSFFSLGVEHILTGFDHLLFLAALLLVCATFGQAATIITCFTVAHSITLALAALDVVRLPSRVVEPLIAASIVYVALENLWARGASARRLRWRAAVTFGFGLVHGLGFASVLRELGLGRLPGGVVLPLLKFNLGVEAGQLAVATTVFPLLLAARRRGPVVERRWVPACSALIACAGAWWLVERVLG